MVSSRVFALASCLLATISAQTPDGFNLTTSVNLPISFGSLKVSAGQSVAVSAEASHPIVTLPPSLSPSDTYIINMVDPDAPFPGGVLANVSEVLHWLQPDVTFNSNGVATIKRANAVATYLQPAPPTPAKHRYIVLLFKQTGPTFNLPASFKGFTSPMNRTSYDALRFSREAGLGEPVAATYFLTGNDTVTSNSTGSGSATGTGYSSGSPTGMPIATAGAGTQVLGLAMLVSALGVAVAAAL